MKVHVLSPEAGVLADIFARREEERQRWWAEHARGFVNVSRIVWDMMQTMYPKLYGEPGTPYEGDLGSPMRIETGFLIEELLAEEFARRAGWSKPPAVFRDAIGGRPDGASPRIRTVDEVKVTWVSAHCERENTTAIETNPKLYKYVLTAAAYCAMYGWTRARVHVFYVNGDYRPPKPMPPMTHVLRFGAGEVETKWKQMRRHAADRGWIKQRRGLWVPAE